MGLRYFGIRVTDLGRSVEFYTKGLGLKRAYGGTMRHGGKYVLLQDPRTRQRLELNWYPPGSPYATPYVPGDGLDHIGFHVSDPARAHRRLVEQGATSALVPRDRDGVKGIYYATDPDGNWIEFY